MAQVLLASASPRRLALIEALGHDVTVHPVAVDESELPGEAPAAYQSRIVDAKLQAAVEQWRAAGVPLDGAARSASDRSSFLVVADTMVVLDGHILHKPEDPRDHVRMLTALSGREHEVTTRFAVCLWTGAAEVQSVKTRVWFRQLAEHEIETYVLGGEGSDKAGGYAIQGRGSGFVLRIDGSYSAVVGLPSAHFEVALQSLLAGG